MKINQLLALRKNPPISLLSATLGDSGDSIFNPVVPVPVNNGTTSSLNSTSNSNNPTLHRNAFDENAYQEAVRVSSVEIAPTTGLSLQQLLDMCNRDFTPEDYELLLRLDEAVEKKPSNKKL
jgi:hypothetical protein